MQNLLIEKPYEFVGPIKTAWPQTLYTRSGLFRPSLKRLQGVVDHECRNLDRLKASIDAGHGVMMAPNHPRLADPMVFCFVARETPCNFYAMASWHLFNQGWFTKFMIRMMGAFSVNREGLDRQAIDYAIKILQHAERPLLIFPEGATSRTNDGLMALMEGPAFIARTAAKRRAKENKKVVIHPIGIKYLFQGDIEKACDGVLTKIEKGLSWKPLTGMSLIERLVKVGNALLTLKELQYDVPRIAGTLRERQTCLRNHLLAPLEREWLGEEKDDGIQVRVKNLRMKIFPEMTRQELSDEERHRRWDQLARTYLAQQVDCYPEKYLYGLPSIDRILETCEKFEEDLTGQCTIHGNLKVIIDVDDAIEVSPERVRGVSEDPIMAQVRERLEARIDELQHESRLYESE